MRSGLVGEVHSLHTRIALGPLMCASICGIIYARITSYQWESHPTDDTFIRVRCRGGSGVGSGVRGRVRCRVRCRQVPRRVRARVRARQSARIPNSGRYD